MGRGRKPPPDPAAQEQLRGIFSALARSGAAKWFVSIRRRRPSVDSLWQYWKRNLAIDQIDDIAEYCYKEGGDEWEYRIKIHDSEGRLAEIDGQVATEYTLPSLKTTSAPVSSIPPGADPSLIDRKKRLDERRLELDIERQEAELERQRRKLERVRTGDDEEEEEDEEEFLYPPHYGPYGPMPFPYPMSPYMNPYMNPALQNRPAQVDPNVAIMAEAFKALAPQRQQSDSSVELLKVILPLLTHKSKDLDPKDWMSMMTPMIGEMAKASSEANKIVMSSLSDMDQSFRERLLDLIMADPSKTEDEIAKWKGYLNMGMDVLKEGTRLVLGRGSIVKGGDVKVPVVEKPKTPGLPSPGKKPETETRSNPGEKTETPAEAAKRVIAERVNAFLSVHEQELLVGSDPILIVEKLDELWSLLPQTLRFKLEHSDTATIYESLREYDAATVDRILEAVKKDESGALKKWCETFWEEMKLPPDDEGGEEVEEPEPTIDPAPASSEKG